MLKVWNMVLVSLAFLLSIFGTFLTRSGVINSIHSFSQSPIGGWFLGFIVFGLIWLMSRPKDNVLVYGPRGQQMTVSEKEAKKRVEKQGWSYTPKSGEPT